MQTHFPRSRCRRFRRAGHTLRDFDNNYQLGYDAAGRLARTSYGGSSAFQFYDLSGQRIFKTDSQNDSSFTPQNPAGSLNPNTAGVYYQYDQNGNLLFQHPVGGVSTGLLEREAATHYYWLPTPQGDILVGFDQGINSYAVYTDHLGTPRLVTKIENPQNPKPITDTSNDLPLADYGQPEGISPQAIPVWQWSYSPFGADLANGYEAQPTSIQDNFKPALWSWVGLPETGGANPNQVAQETWRVQANLTTPPTLNIRYPGQYYDFESGLVQNWWRTYEPRIGRYTSADPIGLNGGWNRFAYVNGNSLSEADPSGLIPLDTIWDVGNVIYDIATGSWDDLAVDTAAMCVPYVPAGITKLRNLKNVQKYEVGTYDALKARSLPGDGLDIHHVAQKHPAGQSISGYDPRSAPSIALPRGEHLKIPTVRGSYSGNARDQLAKDIRDLRNNTNAPNGALRDLINLNKQKYPGNF